MGLGGRDGEDVDCVYILGGERLVLPLEIEEKIVEMLRCDLQAVVKARRLSRRWRWLVDQTDVVWRDLPLQLPKRFPGEAEKW